MTSCAEVNKFSSSPAFNAFHGSTSKDMFNSMMPHDYNSKWTESLFAENMFKIHIGDECKLTKKEILLALKKKYEKIMAM